ncbi:GEVED domain-containing protein, partial [Bacteroidia bacterium]|nr:GEVED domain-containing protein [Bacteroidia bacterium]
MKKIFLKSFSLLALSFFYVHTYGQNPSQDYLRTRLDSFLKQHPSSQHDGLTKKDLKKLPKYDRPDLAAEQDYYMTIDPNTLSVPSQKKYEIMQHVDSVNNASSSTYTAITGVTWEERGPDNFGGRTRALMFDPTDSANGYKKVWAGGVAGGLWYNGDITSSSTAWSKVDDFWPNLAVTTIAFDPSDDSTFYVGTGEGWYNSDAVRGQGVWKSTNAGQTWTQLSSTNSSTYYYIQKILVTSSGRVIVATRTNLVYSDNGGASWTNAASGAFSDIEQASNGDLYCSKGNLGSSGDILKSTNNGTSWSSVLPSGAGTIRRVEIACAPSDSNVVYAIAGNTSYGVAWIKKTTNGGSSWSNIAIPVYQNNTSQDFTRGQAWYDLSLAVSPANSAEVIAGGIDLHKSTNSGTSWSSISHWYGGYSKPYVHADQHSIAFRPGNDSAAIFSNDGGVSYSPNAGSNSSPSFYTRAKGYNVTQFYSVAMKDSIGSHYMLAGAQDNGSHKFTSDGVNSTSEVTGGDGGFCFVDQDNPTYQITAYTRNRFYRSINGGNTFSSISSSTSGRFINPADYDDDANILYSAAAANQLFRVIGITGTIASSTLTIGGSGLGGVQASHIRCSPYSNNVLFVGTSSGGIYKVINAHSSPTSTDIDPNNYLPTGYISCIELGASDSQMLVTYSNYGVNSVWETTNGGGLWTSKEGNLPNMPVRWALYNPNDRNQVLLATEVGVWSTNDLAATAVDWDPSNNGLANVRCDMLQIRSSDNIVAIATHGRGVFTTDVFYDTTIVSQFSIDSSYLCKGYKVAPINESIGNIKYYKWSFSPATITYTNGTDSASESPIVQLNASGQYTMKLVCSDSLGTDIDSFSINNAIQVAQSRPFGLWKQDFDTINAISGNALDSVWSLEHDSDYHWEIDSNHTLSSTTGPSEDYSGSGNYLFAEASTPAIAGDLAYIESVCIEMPDTGYVNFAYHLYGSTVGSLELQADTGSGWVPLTQLSGAHQPSDSAPWKVISYDLANLNNKVARLRLESTRGTNWDSDIAIDELSFKYSQDYCEKIKTSQCFSSTNNTTYDIGVRGVKISGVQYSSSGVNVDGPFRDNVCTDTFTVSDLGFVLEVNGGTTYNSRVRAFIDYNNDGQFDTATEMAWYSKDTINFRSDSVFIPSSARKGKFIRMRIMVDYGSSMINAPCGNLSYGEAEDFGLKIIPSSCNLGLDLGNDTTVCGGMILNAESHDSYLWNNNSNSSSLSVTSSGDYTVTVSDGNGCTAKDTITVTVNALPSINLGPDT